MFWGMNLKPNRKYSQTTSKSFHISQAALDCDGIADDASNKIYISGEDNQKFLICTLRKNACEQAMLDLNFAEGDTISFQSIGTGNVSLSGYLTIDPSAFMDEGEEEMSDVDEELTEVSNGKDSKKKKKSKKDEAAGSDEEEDDGEDDDALLKAALESDDDEDGDNDEDDDEEEDDEDDDEDEEDDESEEIEEPKPKVAKVDKKESKQQQQQQLNGVTQNASKTKKEKKAEKQQQKQQQQQTQKNASGGERTLAGGVKIEDIRVGNGPEAKTGKRAQVYYEGRLKTNNKTFDSLKNGAPFKFGIGRGEVIKGWDVGVVGMKVGGKRRITCPPHMAYGARGSPPAIPPNSTLVFEVELKGVN